jgi:hypothetical protein
VSRQCGFVYSQSSPFSLALTLLLLLLKAQWQ